MAQTQLRDSFLRAWLELPYFCLALFAPLSYDCPLQSSKGIPNSSSLVRIMDAKCWPVDSSASTNPIKCSLIWGFSISDTTLMTIDNCSVWLISGVQSRIIEKKDFACLMSSTIADMILLLNKSIRSFCTLWPR